MQIKVTYKGGQWQKSTTEWERLVAHAATAGVRECGKAAQEAGRAEIASAGFTTARWRNSIKSVMHPKSGDVLNPWAWVHLTINFADVFETGKVIEGKPLLWLPLPSVPKYPGDPSRQMSPKRYIQAFGPNSLRGTRRTGSVKPLLLGQVAATTKPQPFGAFGRPLKRGSLRKGRWIPMFVGVPQATIRRMFDVTGAIEKVADDLPQFYLDNLEKYIDPNGPP